MADNSIIKLLKYYLLKLKSFFFTKNVLSFSLFLVLSSGFWFVNILDKIRETEIIIPLRIVGLPQNISIINKCPQNITLLVKDQGINLFAYRKSKITPISIEMNGVFYEKGEIIYTSDQIRAKLSRFLLPTTSVLEITPDSLIIQYEKLSVKTLPIELNAKIDFAHQYVLSDKIYLSPSKITVFGPKGILDKLKSVKTEALKLTNISDTIYMNCKLIPIKNVNFAADETKVSIYVEMFTEKKMQLPISIVNCPPNIIIRTFPAFVNVTFNVGLSHFKSVNTNDLKIVFDYNDIIKSDNLKYSLKIQNETSYISNIRISPNEVEYLLEKQ
jgi:hypothetical protein